MSVKYLPGVHYCTRLTHIWQKSVKIKHEKGFFRTLRKVCFLQLKACRWRLWASGRGTAARFLSLKKVCPFPAELAAIMDALSAGKGLGKGERIDGE
jgi:hypothetical protein